jgi:hypothetical protein
LPYIPQWSSYWHSHCWSSPSLLCGGLCHYSYQGNRLHRDRNILVFNFMPLLAICVRPAHTWHTINTVTSSIHAPALKKRGFPASIQAEPCPAPSTTDLCAFSQIPTTSSD